MSATSTKPAGVPCVPGHRYMPHPIWFAANHTAMRENGTPTNHATPYFIFASPRSVHSNRGAMTGATSTGRLP